MTEALKYFNGNTLAASTWEDKYALSDLDGNVLEDNPDDMHKRMAEEFSKITRDYDWNRYNSRLSTYGRLRSPLLEDKCYGLFHRFKRIIPQGSIMSGLGDTFRYKLLSNCVVLDDVVDSYGGICYTDQQLAQLMKRRAGVGVDISNLRPRGAATKNAAKTSTGAVSFLKRFSDTTNEVAQEGRRGALMVTLDCRHPDVMEFVHSKNSSEKITGANISIKWTDDFLEAARNGESYTLRWPVDEDPEDAEITVTAKPQDIMEAAAARAHGLNFDTLENSSEKGGGDPGCMFIDRMKEYSTDCGYPEVTVNSTNPCGEIGMQGGDCCRLIALNFMSAVEEPFSNNAAINYNTIEKLAYEQQVLLDNLVDLEIEHINRIIEKVHNDPEKFKYKRIELDTLNQLRENAQLYRRTGGGFTALADALAAVGVEYASEEGNEVVDKMMRAKFKGEWNASIDLAINRGPFPEWDPQYDDTEFFDMMEEEFPDIYERNMEHGRRNISLSTVAPTGSVSLLANIGGEYGTSSGIEPAFSTEENVLWHTRNKKINGDSEDYDYVGEDGNKWKQYKVFHEGFRQWLEEHDEGAETGDYSQMGEGWLKERAKESPYVTSAGLEPEQRIKLQSIVQKYTTHSISSTLNLPTDADWTDTLEIYEKGYEHDLKGVTIFRNGSKRGVLESSDNSSDNDGRGDEIVYHNAPERPKQLDANIHIIDRGEKVWIIAIGILEDKPYEVFVIEDYKDQSISLRSNINNSSKFYVQKNGSQNYQLLYTENKYNLLSDILRLSPSSDADVLTRMTSQLMRHGVKMDYIVEQVRKADITINDFSKILGDVLAQYTSEEYTVTCSECGSENVHMVEGCYKCVECGASKCG